MNNYKYTWRDDPKQKDYTNEKALKKHFPDSCEPEQHEWKSTFSFGVEDCAKCKARRRTVP